MCGELVRATKELVEKDDGVRAWIDGTINARRWFEGQRSR